MKLLKALAVFALLRLATALIFALAPSPAPAAAFEPPNQRWFGNADANQLIPKVAKSVVMTWRATDNYGWAGWRGVLSRSLDSGSDYQYSLGNVFATVPGLNLTVREARAGELADTDHRAESAAVVETMCNGAFATACVFMLNNLSIPVYYKAPLMMTYIFTGQAATIGHEGFHPLAHACDLYPGGCPPTQGQPLSCDGNPDTLMSCGLAARYPQLYDIATLLGAYTPDHPSQVSARLESDGWVTVRWNHDRKDGGFASPFKTNSRNGVEVAFAFSTGPGAPFEWAGRLGCGEAFGFCYAPEASGVRGFDTYWTSRYRCVAVHVEGPVTRLVPQSSQLGLNGSPPAGYWAQAGCW